MRIALCQINTKVADFKGNLHKIGQFLNKAVQERADLVVFPELALSSYPPLDLLDRPDFFDGHQSALNELQALVKKFKTTVIFGALQKNETSVGRELQNCALLVDKTGKLTSQPKRLLPTYDVFDEARYFHPGTESDVHDIAGLGRVGLVVCEDSWFEELPNGRTMYQQDPALDLVGADLVVNVSASPFELNKRKRRREMLAHFIKRTKAPLVYVNMVGANDEILFDGASSLFDASGKPLFELPAFCEALGIVEFDPKKTKSGQHQVWSWRGADFEVFSDAQAGIPNSASDLSLIHRALVVGIRDYFAKTGFKKAVIGLSGGIDSAVVATLAAEALGPENVLGVSMPSQYSSTHSIADAEALAKSLGIEYRSHSIKFVFSTLNMELKSSFGGLAPDVTEENMQSRLRGVMLMALANKRNALVLTTGNKSEIAVGYCTIYGDMAGALAPIGDLYKTKVYDLAKYLNSLSPRIPESSITKPPSAELRPNQTDQDSLPPYETLDAILELYFEGRKSKAEIISAGFEAGLVSKILRLIDISEFKRRQGAPILKLTSKAFGIGRRVPVVRSSL